MGTGDTSLCTELYVLVFGWLISLAMWFQFVIIALCEPDLSADNGICVGYYSDNIWTESPADDTSPSAYERTYIFIVPLVISYCMYFCVLMFNIPISSYVSNRIYMPLKRYQRRMIDARPTCWLKVECHHRGSKGKRVVTKREREEFHFVSFKSSCLVIGEDGQRQKQYGTIKDSQSEDRAESSTVMRIQITKKLKFTDQQTERACEEQLDSFVRQHTSDENQSRSQELSIPDCYDHVLVVPIPGKTTFVYSPAFYYLCVLLTFGIPYITFFYLSTKFVDLVVKKELSLTQNDDDIHQQV
eukprot:TRINITY_DN1518_c0_g1_i2.p1 TRINITY_DN1518_c0_g1~~TRINITY_DN1518_c0_g1_i2.p1  ORF type:complete len:300 (+),score=22.29 TRINITY_DN1518_c0_g1_i2:32-931(+)